VKKIISFIVVLFCGFSLYAQTENDFTVQKNSSGKITITGYTGTVRDVIIPSKISGIDVTEIGEGAFNGRRQNAIKLTSVIIPNTVRIIGLSAFEDNEIVKVVFGTGVTEIGLWAFYNNKLTTVTIGRRVTAIKEGAFDSNQLTEVIIPNSVTTLEKNAFNNNPLQTISIGTGIGNLGIYPYPFGPQVNITSITIGRNVNINILSGLDSGFINFYNSQNKRAGTYVKNGQTWARN